MKVFQSLSEIEIPQAGERQALVTLLCCPVNTGYQMVPQSSREQQSPGKKFSG